MPRLFVFAIGGTGSRVLKSLAMLMASGLVLKNEKQEAFDLVPIVIDPDVANGDLDKTSKILGDYQKIRKGLKFEEGKYQNRFFSTPLKSLRDLSAEPDSPGGPAISEGFAINFDVQHQKFKEFVGLTSMRPADRDLMDALFSQENLDEDMSVGFKGHPNIGSAVLNSVFDTKTFDFFERSVKEGDRIFIVSSIFGGTGAAGFPLLIKKLEGSATEAVRKALKGAVTIQPYFKVVSKADGKIDANSFVAKTKAALTYYDRTINNRPLAMYYLGDKLDREYKYEEGAKGQENDAHFIELAAALSIVDFAGLSAPGQGKGFQVSKEFGIKTPAGRGGFGFTHLQDEQGISAKLTQFHLMENYLESQVKGSIGQPWAIRAKVGREFLTQQGQFYSNLQNFNTAFASWLHEMRREGRSFAPFADAWVGEQAKSGRADLFVSVNGIHPKPTPFAYRGNNWALFEDRLNHAANEIIKDSPEVNLMEVFFRATQNLIETKYNFSAR